MAEGLVVSATKIMMFGSIINAWIEISLMEIINIKAIRIFHISRFNGSFRKTGPRAK